MLVSESERGSAVQVLRVKNYMAPDHDSKASAGYRVRFLPAYGFSFCHHVSNPVQYRHADTNMHDEYARCPSFSQEPASCRLKPAQPLIRLIGDPRAPNLPLLVPYASAVSPCCAHNGCCSHNGGEEKAVALGIEIELNDGCGCHGKMELEVIAYGEVCGAR